MPPSSPHELIESFMEALNRGDLDKTLRYYERDAILIAQPGKISKGKNEIRASLEEFLALRPKIKSHSSKIINIGNLALYCSKWNMVCDSPDGETIEMNGMSSDVFRQQPEGNWLVAIDNPWGTSIID